MSADRTEVVRYDRAEAVSEPLMRHCRHLSIHEPHVYTRASSLRITNVGPFSCPGIPHDHERFCCTEHHHHVSPHVGCILR